MANYGATADAGGATFVSLPGGNTSPTDVGAPGAFDPGSAMQVHHAAILIIVSSAVALVAIGVIFRRPIGRD